MITWKEYLVESEKTAVYYQWASDNVTQDVIKAVYPILGLVGELAELREKIINYAGAKEIQKEISDCNWYLADIARIYNIVLSMPSGDAVYGIYIHNEGMSILDTINHVLGIASDMCNVSKKVIRDSGGFITFDHSQKIAVNLQNVFEWVVYLCHYFVAHEEYPFEYILQMNLDKLFDRKERGVLGGEGDNR